MRKSFLFLMISLSCTAALATPSKMLFSPYADLSINTHWDAEYQDLEPMNLDTISQETGIKDYHLAFITDAGKCEAAWAGQSAYAVKDKWGVHLTDRLRANGVTTVVAFGGAVGVDISQNCNETQLLNVFEQVLKTYQPRGLDFDIENGTANVPKLMTVLQQVQGEHPQLKISFTLPVMPEGLTEVGKNIVNQAKAAGLHYNVNIMAMDYGSSYLEMGKHAIQAANNLFDFLKLLYPDKTDATFWQMIEVTPMIGVNDVKPEQFTLADATLLNQFAREKNLGGLSMWSIARDNPCVSQEASATCSGNNLQTKPYDFALILNG